MLDKLRIKLVVLLVVKYCKIVDILNLQQVCHRLHWIVSSNRIIVKYNLLKIKLKSIIKKTVDMNVNSINLYITRLFDV